MAKNDSPQDPYGQGYEGYKASKPKDDPYGSYGQQQQQSYQAPDSYQQSGYGQQQQQQFASYQAPLSTTIGGTSADDPTSIGLSGRIEALLSYLFVFFGGIFFFLFERKNRFVRFAAAQSFLFFVPAFIVYEILKFIAGILGVIPVIGSLLLGPAVGLIATIFGILLFLIWLYLIIQSLRGKTVRLPFFSGYAQALVDRTTRRRSA